MFDLTSLNIVDILIILAILLGGLIGLKDGVIKKIVSILGLIAVLVLAFTFKNNLSLFFYDKLPFFNLWGIFKGLQVLNILFYETLAFLLIASLLMLAYKLLLFISKLLEKILKATVILAVPSKLLGLLVGLIEYYILVYIALFIFTLPIFNIEEITESKIAVFIIENTPILSKYTSKTFEIYDEVYTLIEKREDKTNEELNEEAMILMLEYDIITKETAINLIDKGKVDVNNKDFLEPQSSEGE